MNGKILDKVLEDYEKVNSLLENAEHTVKTIKKSKVEYESKILDIAFELLSKVKLYETDSYSNSDPIDVVIEYNDNEERWEIELD